MGNFKDTQLKALAKKKIGRHHDGDGLYFVVPKSVRKNGDGSGKVEAPGKPYWMLRFTYNKKRHEMTLGRYPDLSAAEARLEAALKKRQVREGQNPIALKKRAEEEEIKTVNDLFKDWHEENKNRLKHWKIPERVYQKDISPHIGALNVDQVTARDIRRVIKTINDSGRPTISNDALLYCKQLFNHGIKIDVVGANPASAFQVTDAGGIEKSRDRALTLEEVRLAFKTFRENQHIFTRDNYLACALLVLLGVRKSELCEARWNEFDLDKAVWELPKERSKSGVGLTIPLPDLALEMFTELKTRSAGSEYVLPSRRQAKRPHMGPDTLNRAIGKMFGYEPGKNTNPPNLMGDMEYFRVHDLRRTCRTLLASIGVPGHVAERCLNHKLKGVEGIYDQYDYFDERKDALTQLAELLKKYL